MHYLLADSFIDAPGRMPAQDQTFSEGMYLMDSAVTAASDQGASGDEAGPGALVAGQPLGGSIRSGRHKLGSASNWRSRLGSALEEIGSSFEDGDLRTSPDPRRRT